MKKTFPHYKGKTRTLKDVFNEFSKENQKIINDFLEYCRISAGDNSIIKIQSKIITIADVLEKPLNQIDLTDLRKFLAVLNNSDRGTDNQNDIKKTLKRFLKWKYSNWEKKFNKFEDIKQKRKPTKEKLSKDDLLGPDEVELLIRNTPELKFKAMIILFYESASRPEELLNLKWKNCNLDNNEIKLSSAKTGETRIIPIDKSVNRLKLYKQEYPFENVRAEDYVFPSPVDRKKPVSNQTINYFLKTLGKKVLNKKLYPYIFRHSRLNSVRKSLSPDVYQKFAGHSIEVGLEHYSHIDNDDVREEMFQKIYDIEESTKEEKEQIKELKKLYLQQQKQISELQKYILFDKPLTKPQKVINV